MRRQILGWTATLGLMATGNANAIILTFDSVPSTDTITTSVQFEDFNFTSAHFHTYGCGHMVYDLITFNGTTHLGYEAGRGSPITMARADGQAFSLLSLDASEFYAVLVPDRPNANSLQITGYLEGGETVSHTLQLDGLVDGPYGPLTDFQHFVLPDLFINVTSIAFTGLQLNGVLGGVAIDNLEVADRVSVPEPTTLALLGIGLISMGMSRRRRSWLPWYRSAA
jgi:PEP-CTERM motif